LAPPPSPVAGGAERHGDDPVDEVLAQSDAGIEFAGNEVEERVIAVELDDDVGIGIGEGREVGLQHRPHGRLRDIQAQ
jgi:hypothetical protein